MVTADKPALSRTLALTSLALVAFAGNSLLCRQALRGHPESATDPAGFTILRLASGALVLALLRPPSLRGIYGGKTSPGRAVQGALALFFYALLFSLAYVSLDTGSGALLLFGAVQLTMVLAGWLQGERPTFVAGTGIAMAALGVTWLVLPGASAPAPLGALLMALAGVAWGVYSLLGRGEHDPVAATARNFLNTLPLCALVLFFFRDDLAVSWTGAGLACASGALTSGMGYVVWYGALQGHTATTAAVVQLAVPPLAAVGGVLLLGEAASLRLLGAGIVTLGGIGIAVAGRPATR